MDPRCINHDNYRTVVVIIGSVDLLLFDANSRNIDVKTLVVFVFIVFILEKRVG